MDATGELLMPYTCSLTQGSLCLCIENLFLCFAYSAIDGWMCQGIYEENIHSQPIWQCRKEL